MSPEWVSVGEEGEDGDGLKTEKAWQPTVEINKEKAAAPTITSALQLHQHHFNWPQSAFVLSNNDGHFYGALSLAKLKAQCTIH